MSDRCPYHDDLVIAVGCLHEKLNAIHEDIHEIKVDLYTGNGISQYVTETRGQMKLLKWVLTGMGSAVIAITVVVIEILLRQ